MSTVVVSGRHRPHEVMFLGVSALIGAAYVVGAKPPASLEQQLPAWMLWAWYVLLLISGLVGMASFAVCQPYTVLLLERAAMYGQVAAPALYGLGLLGYGRAAGLFAGAFCLAWSAASAWRLWQVSRELRQLRAAAEEPA